MISMTKLGSTILASIALVAFLGCQQDNSGDSNDTKTIDNFTRGSDALTVNSCGLNVNDAYLTKLSPTEKAKLKHIFADSQGSALTALGVFLAVPKPLQTLFFAAKGELRVVKEPERYCGALTANQKEFASEGQNRINSCWGLAGGKVQIFVRDEGAAIHHGLIRAFGYLFTQFYARRLGEPSIVPPELRDQVAKGLERYRRQHEALANAMLRDLPAGPVKDQLTQTYQKNPDETGDFAVAEMIDSIYCSDATRETFRKEFPASFAAFTSGNDAMILDLGQPLKK